MTDIELKIYKGVGSGTVVNKETKDCRNCREHGLPDIACELTCVARKRAISFNEYISNCNTKKKD